MMQQLVRVACVPTIFGGANPFSVRECSPERRFKFLYCDTLNFDFHTFPAQTKPRALNSSRSSDCRRRKLGVRLQGGKNALETNTSPAAAAPPADVRGELEVEP